jgi:GT2 family glycosyltransferase
VHQNPLHPGAVRLSVIVPFHRNIAQLQQCLTALRASERSLPAGTTLLEIIVVPNGATEDLRLVADAARATLLAIDRACGPAVARNRAVEIATGNVLVFVDTDVVVNPDALGRLAALFQAQPDAGAAFGAYDEAPADSGFVSQCKNLAHSFVHQLASGDARTFWAGLGAVRSEVFARVGGFDERFPRPSVEDIDLGYRIHASGARIILDPDIRGKHLKRWTFKSAIVTDVRDRGVPWTQLIHRYDGLHDDLNVSVAYRWCVVIAYVLAASLVAGLKWPLMLSVIPIAAILLWVLDRHYYGYFVSRRGLVFALRWFPLHIVHHLCNGVSFAVGTGLYMLGRRSRGLSLPGLLPSNPWPDVRAAAILGSTKRLFEP